MAANREEIDLIVNAISQGFDKVSSEIKDTAKETEMAGDKAKQSSTKWTELNSALNVAQNAFGKVKRAAQFAYENISEGADLNLARTQFDNLSESIGTTSDSLLFDLKQATSGMVSDAELIVGATDIINLGLADTQEGTVRLATAVSTLGLDMQQVILTFANNSKARLDALGLSVEGVTTKAAELEAQGFQGDAFDEAVLIGLEEKMELFGDAAETTAGQLQILESDWANLTNSLKQGAAEAVGPAIRALVEEADAQKLLNEALEKGVITSAQWRRAQTEAATPNTNLAEIVEELGLTVSNTSEDIERMVAEAEALRDAEAGEAIEEWGAAARLTSDEIERLTLAQRTGQKSLNEYGAAARLTTDEIIALSIAEKDAADAADAISRANLTAAFEAAADPINELISAQQALAAADGEWVQRTVTTAGRIASVNAELAMDLSDDQAKAYREILRTVDEGSAEWLNAYDSLQNDLTQSQRDALIAQQADLANQPDRLVDVYTGDAEGAEAAQERITAANEAIANSYREMAAEAILAERGVTEETLDLLVGIGHLTQEQADARLEFANTATAIDELTESQQFARLSIEEQTTALNALISGEAKTADEAMNLAEMQTMVNDALEAMPKAVSSTVTVHGLEDASSRMGDLLRGMNQLDGRHASASVSVSTIGLPSVGAGDGDNKGDSDKDETSKGPPIVQNNNFNNSDNPEAVANATAERLGNLK